MRTVHSALRVLVATLALGASLSVPATPRRAQELFLAGSYGARLQTSNQSWQLFDDEGAVTRLHFEGCGAPVELPPGLWLLTRDRGGAPKLIAPSATALPPGHAGEIALAACGETASANTLQLPAALITTLESHASSILVQR